MIVEVSINNEHVSAPFLEGKGLHNEFELWGKIICVEEFPPTMATGDYFLRFRKEVSDYTEVDEIERELTEALIIICKVWIFAGGLRLLFEKKETTNKKLFCSNAQQVKQELLERQGLRYVSINHSTSCLVIHEYKFAPLEQAIEIAKRYSYDKTLKLLINYYYSSLNDGNKWFVELYKIKEVLAQHFGSERNAMKRLAISNNDWKYFTGYINNNNLRHFDKSLKQNTNKYHHNKIPQQDISRLNLLAKNWVQSYIVMT
ncbi:hypothetical protein [Geobacter grbiciae]|uniref:hypothetical protein n=1 Tax=Geobacter grbiciae TaxID=155042 RepID=UPI001C020A3D|nr:hypothetical protein [Geobacter grbiciae]MBT1074925.1 hypothetical protein [Geobacter grbiciae]